MRTVLDDSRIIKVMVHHCMVHCQSPKHFLLAYIMCFVFSSKTIISRDIVVMRIAYDYNKSMKFSTVAQVLHLVNYCFFLVN
jgi:hypothetical protein